MRRYSSCNPSLHDSEADKFRFQLSPYLHVTCVHMPSTSSFGTVTFSSNFDLQLPFDSAWLLLWILLETHQTLCCLNANKLRSTHTTGSALQEMECSASGFTLWHRVRQLEVCEGVEHDREPHRGRAL